MKTILEEMFAGNIYPDELIISKDPDYHPLNKKISEAMEIWKKKLSEDDFDHLEALLDLRSKSNSMDATASFVYGFKLGAAIIIEVLSGKGGACPWRRLNPINIIMIKTPLRLLKLTDLK